MATTTQQLFDAEEKAKVLFKTIEDRGLIVPGKTEQQLCNEILAIAATKFGVKDHWGKKIVRTGVNTLAPYMADPGDLLIKPGDILFFDFHPVFDGIEADLGRTYVLGDDPLKHKIKADVEAAWQEGNDWYFKQSTLTGAAAFEYAAGLATRYGYEFGNAIAGHIIGEFPHEQPDDPADHSLDIHPDNHVDILQPAKDGSKRHWILELHFVDRKNNIGAFFEQSLRIR